MVLALEVAQRAARFALCPHCFGRLFATLGHGLTNDNRGEMVSRWIGEGREDIEALFEGFEGFEGFDGSSPSGDVSDNSAEGCYLCGGLFDHIDEFASLIAEKLGDLEYDTILVGSRVEAEILSREEEVLRETSTGYAESIKSELNRETGKRVCFCLDKDVDFKHPDIQAVIDTRYMEVELQINPLYIYGRYRKLVRGIPQTRWLCRYCRGKGCAYCDWKGKLYPTSVEEIIEEPLIAKTGGVLAKLHGAGREDIDARMLGGGRPFVIEILEPRKRKIDLRSVEEEVGHSGSVEISHLRSSNREEVRRIKSEKSRKTYRVKIRLQRPIEERKIKEAIASLIENPISQRTPRRVAHRRSDMIRKRSAIECELTRIAGEECELRIVGESGLYIKELLNGDEGRTSPSLSDLLGVDCEVLELDVLEVGNDQV